MNPTPETNEIDQIKANCKRLEEALIANLVASKKQEEAKQEKEKSHYELQKAKEFLY